uniref:Uncharacterized protein n=1 Tax=Arundo donax TaxID=35708 RepID=A0A0A9GJG5_ARUDO
MISAGKKIAEALMARRAWYDGDSVGIMFPVALLLI